MSSRDSTFGPATWLFRRFQENIRCERHLLNYLNVIILYRKTYYCNTTQSSSIQATVARKSKTEENLDDQGLCEIIKTLIRSRKKSPFLPRERPEDFPIAINQWENCATFRGELRQLVAVT